MVTAAQVSRMDAKLDALVAAIDTDSQPITVAVVSGETREFAVQRHPEAQPDQPGLLVRFENRWQPRTERAEMSAVHTSVEFQVIMQHIAAERRSIVAHQRHADNSLNPILPSELTA